MKRPILAMIVAGTGLGACIPPESAVAPVAAPAAAAPAPVQQAPAPVQQSPTAGVYTSGEQRWFKDQYGRCYHVDARGDRVYNETATC